MNVCFLMYPWEEIAPETDSTLAIIHECVKRGHRVAIATPANLTIRDSVAYAFSKMIRKMDNVPAQQRSFYKRAELKEKMLPLAGFDVLMMRANPPLDPIALNFLDSVKDDVFIVNDIEGLREANNKLYTACFDDPDNTIIPRTHVSKNKEYLKSVIKENPREKMIMKPLNGYGGSGVIMVEKSAMGNVNSLLDFYIDNKDGTTNYIILQDYIDGAEKGDSRILLLNGKPIGAVRRVPGGDDHRSNISAGGTFEKHTLTPEEKLLCKKIGPKLVKDGLYFVGIDVINGMLVEVNVMSPGGIIQINKASKTKIQQKIVDYFEEETSIRVQALDRTTKLKSKLINE
ncbi:glutathione synthase [Nonlabens marinus]|uniref:Glutathione synthetase n=1 Tax=Nonlabens marinus S1-08 TaxID=1454201 RepID=W8W0G6_9FLAO|nr:glutathione synthase [Nonlabens marinus]BAO56291.1 glutathione synthetase [Nonlabens marinus S1-08]